MNSLTEKIRNKELSIRDVARIRGLSYRKARTLVNAIRMGGISIEEPKQEPQGLELHTVDPWQMIDEAIERQDYNKSLLPADLTNEVVVNLPVGDDGFGRLTTISDEHFGEEWADYLSLKWIYMHIRRMKQKIVKLGDCVGTFLRPIKGNYLPVFEQLFSPQQQSLWLQSLLDWLIKEDLLVLLIEGNHPKRADLITGIHSEALKKGVPIRHNRCWVTVKCGERTYKGMMVHKEQGRSPTNPVHAGVRGLRDKYPDADFIVTAHTHIPGSMDFPYKDKHVPIICLGNFNKNSHYSRTVFGSQSSFISFPFLMFDSRKNGMDAPMICKGFYKDKIITCKIEDLKGPPEENKK